MTTDQRVVAKQDIQEVESAKRAGAPYAHHRNQARDTNTKLRQQLANAPKGTGQCDYVVTRVRIYRFLRALALKLSLARCYRWRAASTPSK